MSTELIRTLERDLAGRVHTDPETRAAHARDRWVLSELRDLQGEAGEMPAAVVEPEDLVVLYKLQQPSLEYYLDRPPMLVAWRGEYRYGMKIQPNTELFSPDAEEIQRLLASDRTVYVVVKQEDESLPEAFGVPVQLVAENRKRAIYRNHAEDDGPGTGAGTPLAVEQQGSR